MIFSLYFLKRKCRPYSDEVGSVAVLKLMRKYGLIIKSTVCIGVYWENVFLSVLICLWTSTTFISMAILIFYGDFSKVCWKVGFLIKLRFLGDIFSHLLPMAIVLREFESAQKLHRKAKLKKLANLYRLFDEIDISTTCLV